MSKKCMVEREKKREHLSRKYAAKRAILKKSAVDLSLSYEDRAEAQLKLQALPRNSSLTRARNRCRITGRPRGVYRKVGLCRNKFREHAMVGDIPGLVKSSW